MKKRLIAGAAALALTGMVVAAPASYAAVNAPYKLGSSCSGTSVHGFPVSLKNTLGDTQGSLDLKYSSVAGGTNCTILYDVASGSHSMTLTLKADNQPATASDSGVFSTYAGSISIGGVSGTCVRVSGVLWMGTHSVDRFSYSSGPVACG